MPDIQCLPSHRRHCAARWTSRAPERTGLFYSYITSSKFTALKVNEVRAALICVRGYSSTMCCIFSGLYT